MAVRAFGFLSLVLVASVCLSAEPQVIHLWEKGAPGFEDRRNEPEQAASYWVKNIHNPSVTVFLPPEDQRTGAAVVICPGGGHRELGFEPEGREAGEYFASIGVAAFALKYRLAREPNSPYDLNKHPREDAQRAVRLVRSRASEWGIDPNRIGLLGFSAGGETVAMAAYTPTEGDASAADPIDRVSAKPNFVVYIYPGPVGIPESVPADAPPAFLAVTNDDRGAVGNIMRLLTMYREAGASVEAHIFARGGHAFNMGKRSRLVSLQHWPERLKDWIQDNYILDPSLREEEQRRERQASARREQQRLARIKAREAERQKRIASATELFNPTGTWVWERRLGDSTSTTRLVLAKADGKLSGTYESQSPRGTIGPVPLEKIEHEANELSFQVTTNFGGRSVTRTYHGTISKDAISGYYEAGFGRDPREQEWTARRLTKEVE